MEYIPTPRIDLEETPLIISTKNNVKTNNKR